MNYFKSPPLSNLSNYESQQCKVHRVAIADLIPCQNDEMSQVAKTIADIDSRGILWVLDGWDELPSHLQEKSFLRDVIVPPGKSPITQNSVIVTSRPISESSD